MCECCESTHINIYLEIYVIILRDPHAREFLEKRPKATGPQGLKLYAQPLEGHEYFYIREEYPCQELERTK